MKNKTLATIKLILATRYFLFLLCESFAIGYFLISFYPSPLINKVFLVIDFFLENVNKTLDGCYDDRVSCSYLD